MRIRATCHSCRRDFLFFQLYNADPGRGDRCPHCTNHLGVIGAHRVALAADQAAAGRAHAAGAHHRGEPGAAGEVVYGAADGAVVIGALREAEFRLTGALRKPYMAAARKWLVRTMLRNILIVVVARTAEGS